MEDKNAYEIVSFRNKKSDDLFIKRGNGYVNNRVETPNIMYSEEQMLHNGLCVDSGHFTIHSIKRLHDDQVFTVGEEIKNEMMKYFIYDTIVEFKLKKNCVVIYGESSVLTLDVAMKVLHDKFSYKDDTIGYGQKNRNHLMLETFLYLLMRDELPTGKVAKIVEQIEGIPDGDVIKFTNKHLKGYSKELLNRILS